MSTVGNVARDGCGGNWELTSAATEAAREDTKQLATGSTSRHWCCRKSTHKIGKFNSAKRRAHLNYLLSNESSNSFSPQQGIFVPEESASSEPVGGDDDQ